MARKTIMEKDEGKRVINADGDTIGLISGVRDGAAYIDPEPGISDQIMAKLGWEDIDEDHYRLYRSNIDTITDDEVRVKREL